MAIAPEPFRTDVVQTFTDRLIANFSQPKEHMVQTSCFDDFQLSTDEKLALQREVLEQQNKLLQGSFRSITPYKVTRWSSNAFWFTHVHRQELAMQIIDKKCALQLQAAMSAIQEIVKKEKLFFVKVTPCLIIELPGCKSHDEFNSSPQVLYVEKRLLTPLLSRHEQHEVVRRLYMHYSLKKANEPFVANLQQAVAESITFLRKIPFYIHQKGPLFAEEATFFHFHHFSDMSGSPESIKMRRFMRYFPDPHLLQSAMTLYAQPNLEHDQEKSRKYQLILQTFDARKYRSAKAPLALPQGSTIEYSENEAILRSYLLDMMQQKIAENGQTSHLLSSRFYGGFHTSTFWCAATNEMMRDREPFSKSLEDLTKAIDALMQTDHLRKKKNEEAEGVKQTIDTVQKFIAKVKTQKPDLPKIYYPLMVATLTKMKAEGIVIEWFDTAHKSNPATSDCHIKYRIYG